LCINFVFNETNNCGVTLEYDLEVTIETIINSDTRLHDKIPCIQKFLDEFNKLDVCNSYCPSETQQSKYEIFDLVSNSILM